MTTPIDPEQLKEARDFILFLGKTMRRCSHQFEREKDISQLDIMLLYTLLKKGPLPVKEIAANLPGVTLSSLTRLLDRLEKHDYVRRAIDPKDRRSFVISLTQQAKDLTAEGSTMMDHVARGMLEPLSPAERLMLLELYEKIKRHLKASEK